MNFKYSQAFSRNLGILTKDEQICLSQTKIGIAGMGGVGGEYLISLVRMGIQSFKICDIDHFEIANFNRQFGANCSSINKLKTKTMMDMALQINPRCQIKIYNEPITSLNAKHFVEGCDLVIDGMDFFALEAHEVLINESLNQKKVVVAAVPLGFGASIIAFHHQHMSFSDFFNFKQAKNDEEKALLFALGFGVGSYHTKYIDKNYIQIRNKKGPSIIPGIKASVGLICTSIVKSLLWPHEIKYSPHVVHLDFRLLKVKRKLLMFGNRGWLQKLKFFIAKKIYLKG
ncbi:MAG: ThiF family adenylyltransferase [Bdellovibrionales bacterium]|nr:ThiF family adenylyltransferase [Bdellovibrionales bacterium]